MSYPRIQLENAVVLVTGAGRGIGAATAQRFATKDSTVWLGDLDVDAATDTARTLGADANAHPLDVTDRASFSTFIAAAIAKHGLVDVLVNNAGVLPFADFLSEPDPTSRTTFDVNVWGLVNGMREALAPMLERGKGHVVNVASMAAKIPIPGYLAGWDLISAATPEPALRLGRMLVGDRPGLTAVDNTVRDAYEQSIADQASTRQEH